MINNSGRGRRHAHPYAARHVHFLRGVRRSREPRSNVAEDGFAKRCILSVFSWRPDTAAAGGHLFMKPARQSPTDAAYPARQTITWRGWSWTSILLILKLLFCYDPIAIVIVVFLNSIQIASGSHSISRSIVNERSIK